jgi:hypothetical protein
MGIILAAGIVSYFSRSLCGADQARWIEVKVTLPPTVSRLIWLGFKQSSGAQDQITVRQLRVCWRRAPLWREERSVVYNCCWASPAQSFSGSNPSRLMSTFYCHRFETPPNLEGQVPLFISPRNRVAQLDPQTLGSFPSPPTVRRDTVEVFETASTRCSKCTQRCFCRFQHSSTILTLSIQMVAKCTPKRL